jgi:hypothetical protein
MSSHAPPLAIPASIDSGRKREREREREVTPAVAPTYSVRSSRSIEFNAYVNRMHIQRVNAHRDEIKKIYGVVPMKIIPPISLANYQK